MRDTFEQGAPAPANLIDAPAEFSYEESVDQLLTDVEIAEMPFETQGEKIMDTFIGQMVARNGAVSSHGERQDASQVLYKADALTDDVTRGRCTWEEGDLRITNANGLRGAVRKLASDPRTGELFGHLQERLATDGQSRMALTSIDQITGYLNALAAQRSGETEDWQALVGPIWQHATKNGHEYVVRPASPFHDRNAKYSPLSFERERQAAFDKAVQTAKDVGADTSLLERSGVEVRRRHQERQARVARIAQLGIR